MKGIVDCALCFCFVSSVLLLVWEVGNASRFLGVHNVFVVVFFIGREGRLYFGIENGAKGPGMEA